MDTHTPNEIDEIEDDARRSIVRALNRHPYDIWTRDSLARSLGVSSGLTGKILMQLAHAGMVRRLDGPDEEFTVVADDDY